ncbi:MAG: EAL domain-containing protein [Mariprofundales bacterium]
MTNSVRILIVDDEARNRELLCDLLEDPSYKHLLADSGEAALQHLEQESDVAVVLLDINLPGIDGFETLRQLRLLEGCSDIPVLLFTGAGLTSSMVAEGLKAGAVDFFGKPFNPEWVEAKVASFVKLYLSHKKLERELRLAASVFDYARDGLMIADTNHNILTVNQEFEKMTGYTRQDFNNEGLQKLQSNVHDDDFYQQLWLVVDQDGVWQGEVNHRLKSGGVIPQWLSVRSVTNQQGNVLNYIASLTDVGSHITDRQQLYFLAHYDALTELPNRKLFTEMLEQLLKNAKRRVNDRSNHQLAVMFLDLDRFKIVNDTLGHDVGDVLLKEVAQRLKGCVRGTDMVGRIGGDEFVALISNVTSADTVAAIATKMISVLEEPIIHQQHEMRIGVSIGICMFPDDGNSTAELMRRADVAMYQVKEGGRNNYKFYAEHMQTSALRHMSLEKGLRKALENNEFTVYYQPFINANTGKPIGMEALLRWDSPDFGRVSPAEFIPVAESCGLIVDIGAWVLRWACLDNKQLQNEGFPSLTVAVNLSSRQFHDTSLLTLIDNVLEESGLSAANLELELTEGVIMQESESTADILQGIYDRKIQLSVDDFGTGYSSMSYLMRFKVDKLKVDQSFVRDLPNDKESGVVVQAMIGLAHNLSLTVIAEGVEEREQAVWLAEHDCDEIQGFYFAKPMPYDEFKAFLLQHYPHK